MKREYLYGGQSNKEEKRMTKFGRRIFYRKTTGEVLLIRGEAQGDVIESTIDL